MMIPAVGPIQISKSYTLYISINDLKTSNSEICMLLNRKETQQNMCVYFKQLMQQNSLVASLFLNNINTTIAMFMGAAIL